MTPKNCFIKFVVALSPLFVASLAPAAVIVEVGGGLGDTPEDHSVSFDGAVTFTGGVGSATYTIVDPTIGTFSFDITFTPDMVGGSGELNVDTANGSLFFIAEGTAPAMANEFNNGDIYSITVSNVVTTTPATPGTAVVMTGFTNLGLSDTAVGEGATIGGTTFLRGTDTNGDGDPRQGLHFATSGGPQGTGIITGSTLQVTSEGTTSLRGVALNFEAVAIPEPSSTALLGLAGLALCARRKRA